MTLVIGIRCLDGFVIAADDEESDGVKKTVQKIIGTPMTTPEHPYQLAIAFAGDSHGCQSAANVVKGRIELEDGPSIDIAEKAIVEELSDYGRNRLPNNPDGTEPVFLFIIGYRDRAGKWGLWLFNRGQWVPIQELVAIGTGQEIAYSVSRRMFPEYQSLQVGHVHHMATQIVREGRKADGVGGTIHTWSVRTRTDTAPFVSVSTGNTDYLWGMEDRLFSGLRAAVKGNTAQVNADIAAIAGQLYRLVSEVQENSWAVNEYRTFDTPAGHPSHRGFK